MIITRISPIIKYWPTHVSNYHQIRWIWIKIEVKFWYTYVLLVSIYHYGFYPAWKSEKRRKIQFYRRSLISEHDIVLTSSLLFAIPAIYLRVHCIAVFFMFLNPWNTSISFKNIVFVPKKFQKICRWDIFGRTKSFSLYFLLSIRILLTKLSSFFVNNIKKRYQETYPMTK